MTGISQPAPVAAVMLTTGTIENTRLMFITVRNAKLKEQIMYNHEGDYFGPDEPDYEQMEVDSLKAENKRINDEYLALLEWICGNLTDEQVNEATTYVLTKRKG